MTIACAHCGDTRFLLVQYEDGRTQLQCMSCGEHLELPLATDPNQEPTP